MSNYSHLTRRSFAKLGFGAGLGWLGGLGPIPAARGAVNPDYKALVCIFLAGGNDGHNTIVPLTIGGSPVADYVNSRQTIALPSTNAKSLLPISVAQPNPYGSAFGLHPSLAKLAGLYGSGRMAVVANTGLLDAPLTRAQFQSQKSGNSTNMFSHSDQTTLVQTGLATGGDGSGWGGRLADLAQPSGRELPLSSVSLDYSSVFATGRRVQATRIIPGNNFSQYALGYLGPTDPRVVAQTNLLAQSTQLSLVDKANETMQRALELNKILTSAGTAAPINAFPASPIGQQLGEVARIIKISGNLGLTRQVFYCKHFGYDTHGGQDWTHARLLADLDAAVDAFQRELNDMQAADKVTTFTSSEFGRTLQPSGTGSDHGWGGHQFVIGGGVNGGKFYGQFPTLALGGPDDANTRGVLIPTTSVAQVGATLAAWFGTPQAALGNLFPNLAAFPADQQNLGFML